MLFSNSQTYNFGTLHHSSYNNNFAKNLDTRNPSARGFVVCFFKKQKTPSAENRWPFHFCCFRENALRCGMESLRSVVQFRLREKVRHSLLVDNLHFSWMGCPQDDAMINSICCTYVTTSLIYVECLIITNTARLFRASPERHSKRAKPSNTS